MRHRRARCRHGPAACRHRRRDLRGARPAGRLRRIVSNVASNGLDALRTLDAHRQVSSDGFPTPQMVMWSGTGKRLGEVANGVTLPDGTTSITIKRGLLHRALRDEALRRGIRIEVGKRLVGVDERAGRCHRTVRRRQRRAGRFPDRRRWPPLARAPDRRCGRTEPTLHRSALPRRHRSRPRRSHQRRTRTT